MTVARKLHRGEAKGRALAGLSVEWSGARPPPGREGGFVFHFRPSAGLLLDVGGAQCSAGRLSVRTQRSVCRAGVAPRGGRRGWEIDGPPSWPRKTPSLWCPWDPGPARPLWALRPLDPCAAHTAPRGASCPQRGISRSPKCGQTSRASSGEKGLQRPCPATRPPAGESR